MLTDSPAKKIEVIAYSGYRANERPVRFMLDDQRLEVEDILERWRGQDHDYFKVLADDGHVYLIKLHRSTDIWSLVYSTSSHYVA